MTKPNDDNIQYRQWCGCGQRGSTTTTTTIDSQIKIYQICTKQSLQWAQIPPYDALSQIIAQEGTTPTFYENIYEYPTQPVTVNPSEDIRLYPALQGNVINGVATTGNISCYWAGQQKIASLVFYMVGTNTNVTLVTRAYQGGPFGPTYALPTITVPVGCVAIVRWTLPTPFLAGWVRVVSTGSLQLQAIRVQTLNNTAQTESIPFNYDYINYVGNASKDPHFFELYDFVEITADLYPGCYSGYVGYQPYCLAQKFKPGQYKYLVDADYKSNVVWGGLGYANEAAAIAAGWEKIYNKYDYWLNGSLTQVSDQQKPKHYWYRKKQ